MPKHKGELCYDCFDDVTFRTYGQVPVTFVKEMTRYRDAITEGRRVDCYLCDRSVVYNRDEDGRWRQKVVEEQQ